MAYLDWLEQTLQGKLEAKPIGEPVALRGYFHLTSDHGLLAPILAAALRIAGTWFGNGNPTVYAQGNARDGYVSVLAKFPGGQTAVLSSDLVQTGATPPESPSATALLIGNHGTMQFEDAPGSDGLPVDLSAPDHPDHMRLLRQIETSLKEGKAVS